MHPASPDRTHRFERSEGKVTLAIREPFEIGTWSVSLSATRREDRVSIDVLDHRVVDLSPEEARAFAHELLRVAG